MNINALFDKLLVDLADAGVTEGPVEGGCRFLVHDGVPFARLADERMAFFARHRGQGCTRRRPPWRPVVNWPPGSGWRFRPRTSANGSYWRGGHWPRCGAAVDALSQPGEVGDGP